MNFNFILAKSFISLLMILMVMESVLPDVLYFTEPKPLIISTWDFAQATKDAWQTITKPGKSALDAVVSGCSRCEVDRCDGTVGYGGSPDENGESTLDAMIMDGTTMDVGAVANLRGVREAISVARDVLSRTEHTMLAGNLASDFAVSMGYQRRNLSSIESLELWKKWKSNNCQPNFWKNVTPNPSKYCGPYKPLNGNIGEDNDETNDNDKQSSNNNQFDASNHDTIGMIAIDTLGNVATGTSSNGAKYKIPGRVGDSPIVGSGSYADSEVGGAAATGDGDVLMRFAPSFHAVELMRFGLDPSKSTETVIRRIKRRYPNFSGAVIATNIKGEFGAACNGFPSFPFTVMKLGYADVKTFHVHCVT